MVTYDVNYLVTLLTVIFIGLPLRGLYSDIGEPCVIRMGLLRYCKGRHTFCDSKDTTCRCKSGYPVVITPHVCLEARVHKEKCEDSKQCTYNDANSYCTQNPIQSYCDCFDDFHHDDKEKKCLKRSKKIDKPNLTLPLAVVISLAFSCVLCCCMVLLHLYRRRSNIVNSRNTGLSFFTSLDSTRSQTNNQPNTNENMTNLLQNPADTLPSYEAAISLECIENQTELVTDTECPPSYEEVMKTSIINAPNTKDLNT